ncbi:hypothetical protein SRHO_G00175200 [Serrasalmus rhombeus]
MLRFLLLLGCLVTLKGQSAAAEGEFDHKQILTSPTWKTRRRNASDRDQQAMRHPDSAEKPADPCAKGPSITTTQLLTTPAAQLTSTSPPRNFTPVTAAVVKMRSVTELSNDAIITFIEEFARQIQARVNETIKMTVKKITRVTP